MLALLSPKDILGIKFDKDMFKEAFEEAFKFYEKMKSEHSIELEFFSYEMQGQESKLQEP